MFKVFECQRNSDQTEGKGRMVTFHVTDNLDEAVEKVQGEGVMGYGPGNVKETLVATNMDEVRELGGLTKGETIYGYRSRPDGKWDHGFKDLRDLHKDPEWEEYQRLVKKFAK